MGAGCSSGTIVVQRVWDDSTSVDADLERDRPRANQRTMAQLAILTLIEDASEPTAQVRRPARAPVAASAVGPALEAGRSPPRIGGLMDTNSTATNGTTDAVPAPLPSPQVFHENKNFESDMYETLFWNTTGKTFNV
jgi:hypothetical protein